TSTAYSDDRLVSAILSLCSITLFFFKLFATTLDLLSFPTRRSSDLSDRDFFERLDPGEQKRFFEESYKLFSERYGKQNIAYATVHNDEQTPHMHLGVVPMRDGKLQGKNVFNRQELLWL